MIINKKGLTLAEIIIALGLLIMLLTVSSGLLNITRLTFKSSENEYKLQSDMRNTMQFISHKVINATGIALLPEFDPTKLSAGWNYIGVEYVYENGKKYTQVVEYTADKDVNGKHNKRIIATSNDEISYHVEFTNSNRLGENNNVEIIISSYNVLGYDGENAKIGKKQEDLKMTYEASNSIQVIDRGEIYKNATAMAFKDDNRDLQNGHANVIMTFDKSGSMYDSMSSTNPERRIDALKVAANILVDTLAPFDTILIGINLFNNMSFMDNSTDKKTFPNDDILELTNAHDNKANIKNFINNILVIGSTNTGDGIRVAYYKFKEQEKLDQKNNRDAKNHYVLMVDGLSTNFTFIRDSYGDIELIDPIDFTLYKASYYTGPLPAVNVWGGNNIYRDEDTGENIGTSRMYLPTTSNPENEPTSKDEGDIDYNKSKPEREMIVRKYGKVMAEKILTLDQVTTYLVRCGEDPKDPNQEGMKILAEGLGLDINTHEGTQYFNATDKDKLSSSFKKIATKIAKDLWYVEGPK